MGHSVTCTFQVNVNVSNGRQSIMGAMSLKDVKGLILSEIDYQEPKGNKVVNAEIWPQTSRGRNLVKGYDFAIMDKNFLIDYYNVGDNIPFYCF